MRREGGGLKGNAWWGRLLRRQLFGRPKAASKAASQDTPQAPRSQPETTSQALEELLARYGKLIQQQQVTPSSASVSRRFLEEAEQEAATIKNRAQREAEIETARILAEAKQQAQQHLADAHRLAREVTEKEAENILQTSRRRAQIIEDRARQGAQLFLLRAREDIQNYVGGEAKEAYYKLQASLQEVLATAQKIEAEWKNRKVELWDATAMELEEYRAALFGTLGPGQPGAAAVAEEAEPREEVKKEATLEAEAALSEVAPEVERKEVPKAEEMESIPSSETVRVVQAEGRAEEPPASPEGERPAVPSVAKTEEKDASATAADRARLYSGEVELTIAPFTDVSLMPKFYSELLAIQSLKVLRTAGSWDSGTTITVVLDQPCPLVEQLSALPNVRVLPSGQAAPPRDKSSKGQRISLAFFTPGGGGGQP